MMMKRNGEKLKNRERCKKKNLSFQVKKEKLKF